MDRRHFVRTLVGSAAVSIGALNRANAAIYQDLKKLKYKQTRLNAPDGLYWEGVQSHYIFQDGLIMMNNGTLGPIPKPVYNTLMKYFKLQATNPYDCYNFLPSQARQVHQKLASFIHASTDEVVINRNTTEGMNAMAAGLDLKSGDEVLISTHEHPAGYHPWMMKAKRSGIKVTEVELPVPPQSIDDLITPFEKAVTPKTRVISVSHTVYMTGLIFPIKELCEMAHARNILVIADSAHGMGMLNINVKALNVDAFASSPYKWCGAPTGCGILYVKKDVQDRIWPLIASSGWESENARKFETLGQRADPLILGLGEAMDFQNEIGRSRIERRIKTMATYFKEELNKIPGVRLHTSMDPYLSGGLTAFSIKSVEPQALVDYVREKYNIVIRTIGRKSDNTAGVRVSTHIYLSMKEIDMLLEGIRTLAKI